MSCGGLVSGAGVAKGVVVIRSGPWSRRSASRVGARSWVGGSVVVLVLLVAAAGCSGGDQGSGLPDVTDLPTASGPPSGTGPTWTPDQQAAIDALIAYQKVSDAMIKGAPVDMTKLHLVAAEPFATEVGKNILTLKSQKLRVVGTPKSTIRSVVVRGNSATVLECLDGRGQHVISTGPSPTQVTRPQSPKVYSSFMVRSGNQWRIESTKEGKKC
jgi:hypothetical protein